MNIGRTLKHVLSRCFTFTSSVFLSTYYKLCWFSPRLWLGRKNNYFTDVKPWIDRFTLVLFRIDMLHLLLRGKNHPRLRATWQRRIGENAVFPKEPQVKALDSFDFNSEPIEQLHKKYIDRPRPVVLKNFVPAELLQEHWEFDSFMQTYGEFETMLTCPVYDGYIGKLKEIYYPGVYVHNNESLINHHPELLEQAGLSKIRSKLLHPRLFYAYSQLFVGAHKTTGTAFHSAPAFNIFIMLHGKKKWTFYDPEYTPLLAPHRPGRKYVYFITSIHPRYGVSPVHRRMAELKDNCNDAAIAEEFGLQQELDEGFIDALSRCPKLEVTLEPGDVLINCPFWWHEIENMTSTSIAMATRWFYSLVNAKQATCPIMAASILGNYSTNMQLNRSGVKNLLRLQTFNYRGKRVKSFTEVQDEYAMTLDRNAALGTDINLVHDYYAKVSGKTA